MKRFRFPALPSTATTEERLNAISDRQKKVDEAHASFGNQWIVFPIPPMANGLSRWARSARSRIDSLVGKSIGVAFWNVENLFDLEDAPTCKAMKSLLSGRTESLD